jgi:1-acyl-sn-glycerol-3-phosphate acyltransferase
MRLQEWAGERIIPSKTPIARIVSGALVLTARLVVGAEARWAGCKPVVGQRIYVANHTSHADFVVLWASLPPKLRERTHPVAAADYWTRGTVRQFLAGRVFDALLIDRHHIDRSHNVLEIMRQALIEGKSLIVFPEGTRGTGSDLSDFKCGIYHVARSSPDIEIVPVWISNMHRVLPRGAFVPAPLLSSVTFGRPLVLAAGETKQDFVARLRRAVIETGETCKCG